MNQTQNSVHQSSNILEGGHASINSLHTISVGGSVLDFEPIERPDSSIGQGSQGNQMEIPTQGEFLINYTETNINNNIENNYENEMGDTVVASSVIEDRSITSDSPY